ncbi:tetratricopeptide repeat protein [Desulforhopalus sp. 52FAK]
MKSTKTVYALILLLLALVPMELLAGDIDERFEAGNAAYSVGDYDKAITIYEGLLKQEGNSSGLLYNLGNSYAQRGEVGLAILQYERALRIDPSDSDIIGNLAKVRKDSGLFTEEPGKITRLFAILSIDSWTVLAFAILVFMATLLAVRLKYKPSPRSYVGSWVCAMVLLLISITGVVQGYQSYNPLVVVGSDAKLQVSPFEGASSSGAVEQGRLFYSVKTHGDYTYVTDRAGRKGWLKSEAVAAVSQSS